jgi:hypothetical protein
MSLPASRQPPEGKRHVAVEVTRLNYEGQFKPFVYLNVADKGTVMALRDRDAPRKSREENRAKKNPATWRDFPTLTRLIIDPVAGSDLDGSDPAAAGRASARHPAAADQASGPGSGSAGPGSDSDSASKSPLLNRRASQLRPSHLVAAKAGSAAIIAWQQLAANAAAEPVLPTTYVQAAPNRPAQLPHRVPAVRK